MNYKDALNILNNMLKEDNLIFSKREAIKTAIHAIENMILLTQ